MLSFNSMDEVYFSLHKIFVISVYPLRGSILKNQNELLRFKYQLKAKFIFCNFSNFGGVMMCQWINDFIYIDLVFLAVISRICCSYRSWEIYWRYLSNDRYSLINTIVGRKHIILARNLPYFICTNKLIIFLVQLIIKSVKYISPSFRTKLFRPLLILTFPFHKFSLPNGMKVFPFAHFSVLYV